MDYESMWHGVCDFLLDRVLENEIALKEIPRGTRVAHTSFYTMAFRYGSVVSAEHYIETLGILIEDINAVGEDYLNRERLLDSLYHYLFEDMGDCRDKEGYKKLEEYRKTLSEELLRELSEGNSFRAKQLRAAFEECGLIQ